MVRDNFKSWIVNRYGSYTGFVEIYRHKFFNSIGVYRQYREIEWDSVERLVFICKGNICRSAFAEAVARTYGVEAVSCGIDTVEGASANKMAIQTAKNVSVDLNHHKTTPITNLTLKNTDLLVAMEPGQINSLRSLYEDKYQYTLLGLWLKPTLPHLYDPYGTSPSYFRYCFENIETAVSSIVGKCN